VLMDVQMPEMDGFEATEAIRQQERTTGRHIQICAMTAHALKGDRERCLQSGMDAYLSKPIQPTVLYEIIEGLAAIPLVAAGSAPAEASMDWNAALDQMGGSADMLRETITLFFAETETLLPALRASLRQRNAAEVQRLAHTLKGAASCFAARPAEAAATRLEFMGRDNDLTGADEAYGQLEREIERLQQALAKFAPDSPS